MRKFIIKTCLFVLSPLIVVSIFELLLPVTYFSYRHWEALLFNTQIPSENQLYPGINSTMYEAGDLCHHTDKAIFKKVTWITDKLGFRNNHFVEDPDILIIGDSFIAGTGLSQESIVTNQLQGEFSENIKIYNMAPGSIAQFDYYYRSGIIQKPKILIFALVERNLPAKINTHKSTNINLNKYWIKERLGKYKINILFDRAFRYYSIKWIKARGNGAHGRGVPGTDSLMYFLNGKNQEYDSENLQITLSRIVSYKEYCDSLNIQFLFLPIPNKETVYYDLVPFPRQPIYLFELDSLLVQANIPTINILREFNKYRKFNNALLYHLDDTHWNSNGTKILAKIISSELSPLLPKGLNNQ